MNELVEDWLRYKQHNEGRSESTIVKYRGVIEKLVDWSRDNKKEALQLTIEDLEEFTGLFAHREGMSPRARRPMVAAVRGFYAWLHEKGHILEDPATALPYPTAGRPLPVPMQLASAERLMLQPDLDTLKGVRDAAILSVFMGCGLRISGVVGLNESSLILYNEDGRENLAIRTLEKGKKERMVPAPHETRLLIRAYLGHPDLRQIDRSLSNGDRVLFISTRNRTVPEHEYYGEARRISASSIGDMIVKYGEQAGIPRDELRPHAMRHLFGTELTEDDVNTLTVQAIMGHQDANSTEVYTHLAVRKLAKAIHKSNPLSKIRTPVSDLARKLSHD